MIGYATKRLYANNFVNSMSTYIAFLVDYTAFLIAYIAFSHGRGTTRPYSHCVFRQQRQKLITFDNNNNKKVAIYRYFFYYFKHACLLIFGKRCLPLLNIFCRYVYNLFRFLRSFAFVLKNDVSCRTVF